MKDVRIGIIGVGVMGERHCRVCVNLPHVELVGVSDLDETRGRSIAESYETAFFSDYHMLLDEADAVVIATTTPSHHLLAADCLKHGLHVLVEKPIAETVQQADELVQLAGRCGRVLQVGHIERFNPVFLELRNVIEGMDLININVRRLSPFDTSKTDVDVIHDLMIHDLDLIVNLVGSDVETIGAFGRSVCTDVMDHAVAVFSFRTGPVVTLVASRVTENKVRDIELIARGAFVQADLLGKSILIHRRTLPQYLNGNCTTKYRQESIIERIHVPISEPLMLELRHFVECVREDRPSQVSGCDGLRALQLAEVVLDKIFHQVALTPRELLWREPSPLQMTEQTTQQTLYH